MPRASRGILTSLCALVILVRVFRKPLNRPERLFYSAHGQDRWVWDNLIASGPESALELTFVEAGCFDGLTGSNLATFEFNNNWRGLCYEPNPVMFDLVQKRRPRCKKFNSVICDAERAASGETFTYRQVAAPHEEESGIFELMDDYKRNIVTNYTIEAEIQVQCRSLNRDIKTYLNGRVDFLSLDVEGSELVTLQTINWEEISIDVIIVEKSHEIEVRRFLQNQGYHHVSLVGYDNVFIHSASRFLPIYKRGCECKVHGECKTARIYPDSGWLNCEDLSV